LAGGLVGVVLASAVVPLAALIGWIVLVAALALVARVR
jgi:hypothetical protein